MRTKREKVLEFQPLSDLAEYIGRKASTIRYWARAEGKYHGWVIQEKEISESDAWKWQNRKGQMKYLYRASKVPANFAEAEMSKRQVIRKNDTLVIENDKKEREIEKLKMKVEVLREDRKSAEKESEALKNELENVQDKIDEADLSNDWEGKYKNLLNNQPVSTLNSLSTKCWKLMSSINIDDLSHVQKDLLLEISQLTMKSKVTLNEHPGLTKQKTLSEKVEMTNGSGKKRNFKQV